MTSSRVNSIKAKLQNRARHNGVNVDDVFLEFAMERLLYRLSKQEVTKGYLLKGAQLFALWYETPHRPTRDIDLLGFGSTDHIDIKRIFLEICEMYFDDAVVFDASSLKIERTVSNSNSPGIRVNFYAYLGKSELRMQIDIGYGDSVISAPQKFTIHSKIAELGSFQLMTYPAATVVAEKIEAIISLGMANTRLKDFYDLFIILKNERLNMVEVGESIKSTFETRGTTVGPEVPLGLSTGFATNLAKISSWNAFLAKNRLEPIELTTVIERIRGILNPILPR